MSIDMKAEKFAIQVHNIVSPELEDMLVERRPIRVGMIERKVRGAIKKLGGYAGDQRMVEYCTDSLANSYISDYERD